MDTTFAITAPHAEAAALIHDKPVVTQEVFAGLLPELRGRAFTISGVEGATVMQRTRDAIAGVATGGTWDEAKKQIISELDPWLGDGAEFRAELLLRTHAFQAFQAANWRVAQEDADTTHLQYLTMEDERVRDTHAALDGVVLPKDDPFWEKHYPPWEWNCRCMCRPMNPDMVDETKAADENRNPEDKLVIEGPELDQLRNGTLMSEGQRYDVTPPSDGPDGGSAFQWHPDNLRLPVKDLQARYDAPVWDEFQGWAEKNDLAKNVSVWDWLNQRQRDFSKPKIGNRKS